MTLMKLDLGISTYQIKHFTTEPVGSVKPRLNPINLKKIFFKARGLVYINLPWYSTLSLYGDGRVYLLVNHAE